MRDAQHPLFQEAAFDFFGTALFVRPVVKHLLVGADSLAGTAIPNLGFTVVCQPFLTGIFANGSRSGGGNFGRNRQFLDGSSFPDRRIEPGVVEPGKDPLGPFEIGRIGGIDLAVPVVTQSEGLNLTPEIVAVFLGSLGRMRSGLDGILLGWQSESIPSHRMEDIKTLTPLVPANDVGGRVAFGMPNMQACT